MNHAKASHTWNTLTSSPQPGTSFRRSDVLGKRIEYMVSQRWWSQPSSRQHLRTMIHGGAHRTRKLSIYGTQWTTKIGEILKRNLRQRANGQYGKQGTRNGHQHCQFECWVRTTSDVPTGAQKSLAEALTAPQHNVGKGAYTVDLESDEKLYWLGME